MVDENVVQGTCNGSSTELFVYGPLEKSYSLWDINGDKECDLYLHNCCGFTANHGTFWSLVMENYHDNVFFGYYKNQPTEYRKVDTLLEYNTALATVHYTIITTRSCEVLTGANVTEYNASGKIFVADNIEALTTENIEWEAGTATIPYISEGTAQPALSGGGFDTLHQTLKVSKIDCDFPEPDEFKYFTLKTEINGETSQVAVKFTMTQPNANSESSIDLLEVIRL